MRTLVDRVRGLLLDPGAEWAVIEREPGDVALLFSRYVAILALIPALCGFIGGSLIGAYTPVLTGIAIALAGYLLSFVAVYLVAVMVYALAPRLEGQRSFARALKLAVYAHTPVWVAGIFLLMPGASFLTVLGLYGLYLVRLGLPPLLRVPPDRVMTFTAVVGAGALAVALALGALPIALFGQPR
jgi:Yip1 domain